MKMLPQADEDRILKAANEVTRLVTDQGMEPTDAVVKVAQDLQLNPNHVQIVTQAYNVGKTASVREQGKSVLNKLASFTMADAKTAIARLYPKAVAQLQENVSAEYSQPVKAATVKTASTMSWPALAELKYEVDQHSISRKNFGAFQRLKMAYEDARSELSRAKDSFSRTFGSLSYQYQQQPTGNLQKDAYFVERFYGADGKQIVETLATQLGQSAPSYAMPKTASAVSKDSGIFAVYGTLLNHFRSYKQAQEKFKQAEHNLRKGADVLAEKYSDPNKAEFNVLTGKYDPVKSADFLDNVLGSTLGNTIANTFNQMPATKPTADLVNDMENQLTDPQHENELRGIQARSELSDFMANDPVLSGYDPHEVIGAFNDIAKLAPRSSSQPAIMRSLLRKRLTQGGLEPFEAKEMADIEKTLTETRNPLRSTLPNANFTTN